MTVEKDTCDEIFWKSFNNQTPSHLSKNLLEAIIEREIPENETPRKIIDNVEKIIDFNKQQKGRGLKMLTPKQMLQRLPTALAQLKTGNTSENLLNEIRHMMNCLY